MATDLDRLFRENLDQVEVTPSASSWEQVQGQINSKKSYWLMMPRALAAAVALLVVGSWFLWGESPQSQLNDSPIASIDYPIWKKSKVRLYIPEKKSESEEIPSPSTDIKTSPTKEAVKEEIPTKSVLIPEMTIAKLDYQLEVDLPINYQIPNVEFSDQAKHTVKITYVASANTNSPSKIETLIGFFAKDGTSTDILADLRDAKNQIFKRNSY